MKTLSIAVIISFGTLLIGCHKKPYPTNINVTGASIPNVNGIFVMMGQGVYTNSTGCIMINGTIFAPVYHSR